MNEYPAKVPAIALFELIPIVDSTIIIPTAIKEKYTLDKSIILIVNRYNK
jgi:hypothetical protein